MNVRHAMIDRELRSVGLVFRIFNNTFTTFRLRLLGRIFRRIRLGAQCEGMVSDETLIRRDDGSDMRVRIFRPVESGSDLPGVLWLHGGGYAFGSPEQAKPFASCLIGTQGCVVVAPDYRLSTEAPYPAALDDAYRALLWMKDHVAELGIRSDQLMVGGESAGGGLTAALTLYSRDRGDVAIAFQMPLYPMLDDRMITDSSIDNNAPVWNSRSNRNAWKLYLGELSESPDVSEYAAPARARNLAGLPPMCTFVGDLEPFHDETAVYVNRLRESGIEVAFRSFPGCYHAFDVVCPNAEVSREAMSFLSESFAYAAGHYFAKQIRPV